ncbi:30be0fe3-e1c3-4c91-9e62-8ff8e81ba769 [Sclerotinia trifoliorum]|uniref:30be0fe3-e1c3-4c91-9e62-8ff8e81ba769 n=1 Tax=Sclerotinia trifoliorum TaxID=28548 RepID=A0A8H2ZIW4_9HELO|nr:30be0fe3-e1c3-4c91-9e62-8ff8e81ba769 [Sclerotinia trifoliorum]
MFHQPSSWELSLDRAKQRFRNHQQYVYAKTTSSSSPNKLSNSMAKSSKVTTTVTSDYKWHDRCVNETPFNSWLESVTRVFRSEGNTYQEHPLRLAPSQGMQIADKRQHAANLSSIFSATADTRDAAAATSRDGVNAELQNIIAQHLGINVEVSNYHGPPASAGTHTRNLSTSSSPSLSSSFASTAFTEITTSTFDHNYFVTPSCNEAISPTQSKNMPNHLREEKQPAMASRGNSQLDGYRGDKEVNNITREFVPSAILKGGRRLPTSDIIRKAEEVGIVFNPKYKGELTNFNLRNAMCLDHENCSVRIHKIPPEASHCEIFALITHGKVFSFNYIRPVENLFTHAAADLVFLTREAAEKFLHDAKFGHGLYIRGQRITVMWNKIKVLPAEGRYGKMSRVVRIKGPAENISVKILEEFFRSKFEFDLITGKEWFQWDGSKIVELAFSSIRSQSESAVKSFNIYISQNMPDAGYRIWYALDPCSKPNHRGGF